MHDDPMAPIRRLTDAERLTVFQAQSNSIYNKFSPYENTGEGIRFGAQQPFVWTKISDSSTARNLTKYDTQAVPIGSTIRDVQRMGKFMASGTGLLFIGQQYLLQRQTAFNEVRVYNPASILAATAAKGSTGLIERPVRYLDGGFNGGLLNFARNSVLSLVGLQSTGAPVEGVASGPISNYAAVGLSKGKGLLHLEAGKKASERFSERWVSAGQSGNQSSGLGNFLRKLGTSLLNRFVPSTQPLGFGNTSVSDWVYRVEYSNGKPGAYHAFRNDSGKLLTFSVNGVDYDVTEVSPYYPQILDGGVGKDDKAGWYAAPDKFPNGVYDRIGPIKNLYDGLSQAAFSFNLDWQSKPVGNKRLLREQSEETKKNNYQKSVGDNGSSPEKFTTKLKDDLTLDRRGFAKAPTQKTGQTIGTHDEYNSLEPFEGPRTRGTGDAPDDLSMDDGTNSQDVIYFYFYDLVNSKYIPFRATVNGLNDLHSPDWEEVSYLGRADRLYIYKGFTREVNFGFTVYANSLKELLPMWKRINYLVGLSRPSKYTSGRDTTSQFMFPPMTTVRLGDVFVDQPCIIKSIGLIVPDDATWETQRGYGADYSYLKNMGVDFSSYSSDQLFQLPTKVDITINMSIMEKHRSEVSADHYFVIQRGGANIATPNGLTTEPEFLKDSKVDFVDPSSTFKTTTPFFSSEKQSSFLNGSTNGIVANAKSSIDARQFANSNLQVNTVKPFEFTPPKG